MRVNQLLLRRQAGLWSVLVPGLLLLTPIGAAAQDRAFVGGLGGVTFNTVTSGIVAGQGGVRVGPGLFVFGEFGRIGDVLPTEIADEIDDAERLIEEIIGLPASIRASVPALYGWGGVRWFAPGEGRLRPFLEGGLGVAHLTANVGASIGGIPVPDDVIDEFEPVDLDTNELLLGVGGGVAIRLTQAVSVDAGYRYFHVSVEDEAPAVNTSIIYAGVRIGFGGSNGSGR